MGEIISLLGILGGVIFFIYLIGKGNNLVISAIAAAFIMSVTSGMSIIDLLTDTWSSGFAGYLKKFFLIFMAGAVFGRLLSDSGGSKSIALALYELISKAGGKHQKFWAVAFVPMSYALLTYVGVSGLVIVYTVIDIAAELFKRFDVPWRLYCNGGTAAIGTFFLGGSLQLVNLAPMEFTNTTTTAAMGLSIVPTVVFFATMAFFINLDLKKAEKIGEGFMETGSRYWEYLESLGGSDLDKDQDLPSVVLSVIPMATMVILAGFFRVNVLISVVVGCILCIVLFHKRFKSINESITNGLTSAYTPIIGVAATSAIGAIIKIVPGFNVVTNGLSVLPPIIQGVALISIVSFITSAAPGAINSFGEQVADIFMNQVGLSAEVAHRLMTVAAFTGVPPHSPGINNAVAVAKLNYKDGVVIYQRTGLIGGGLALLSTILCIKLGIFI